MSYRTSRFIVPVILLLCGVEVATAQLLAPLRIGYTDHEILIQNLDDYRNVQQQLQTEYESSQTSLQALAEDFQIQVETYQKRQPLLSEARRAEREGELAQLQQELQEQAAQAEQELARREAELLSPLFERVDAAIKKVSAEKGLDLVLRSQVGPTQPVILYANEDRITDITIDVAREMGIDVGDDPTSGN